MGKTASLPTGKSPRFRPPTVYIAHGLVSCWRQVRSWVCCRHLKREATEEGGSAFSARPRYNLMGCGTRTDAAGSSIAAGIFLGSRSPLA
ncbi:unnamed protein product [Scytosiphon promiscuus]